MKPVYCSVYSCLVETALVLNIVYMFFDNTVGPKRYCTGHYGNIQDTDPCKQTFYLFFHKDHMSAYSIIYPACYRRTCTFVHSSPDIVHYPDKGNFLQLMSSFLVVYEILVLYILVLS